MPHPKYITSNNGEKSVVLPLQEFEAMMEELEYFRHADEDKGSGEADADIPSWHQEVVRQRLQNYAENPEQALDFEASMDEIEAAL